MLDFLFLSFLLQADDGFQSSSDFAHFDSDFDDKSKTQKSKPAAAATDKQPGAANDDPFFSGQSDFISAPSPAALPPQIAARASNPSPAQMQQSPTPEGVPLPSSSPSPSPAQSNRNDIDMLSDVLSSSTISTPTATNATNAQASSSNTTLRRASMKAAAAGGEGAGASNTSSFGGMMPTLPLLPGETPAMHPMGMMGGAGPMGMGSGGPMGMMGGQPMGMMPGAGGPMGGGGQFGQMGMGVGGPMGMHMMGGGFPGGMFYIFVV